MGDNIQKNNTHNLASCLSEMKKEIARLQKGTDGLEYLQCKLKQSKIKKKYLQSMYMKEQSEKMSIEISLNKILACKDELIKQIEN